MYIYEETHRTRQLINKKRNHIEPLEPSKEHMEESDEERRRKKTKHNTSTTGWFFTINPNAEK